MSDLTPLKNSQRKISENIYIKIISAAVISSERNVGRLEMFAVCFQYFLMIFHYLCN